MPRVPGYNNGTRRTWQMPREIPFGRHFPESRPESATTERYRPIAGRAGVCAGGPVLHQHAEFHLRIRRPSTIGVKPSRPHMGTRAPIIRRTSVDTVDAARNRELLPADLRALAAD